MSAIARVLGALEAKGKAPRQKGSCWMALCPAHDDRTPSLSVSEGQDGKALIKCFGGCTTEAIASALGLEMPDLFPDKPPSMGRGGRDRLSLAELAVAKGIPEAFLRELGLREEGDGVEIPYRDSGGVVVGRKKRMAQNAKPRFLWSRETRLMAYGIDRLGAARKEKYLFLVEGESDSWTLWHHGVSALGIPGADAPKVIEADHIAGIDRIFVVQESDAGGTAFVSGVASRVWGLGWKGELRAFTIPGAKDPSELHLKTLNEPATFKTALRDAAKAGKVIPVGEVPSRAVTSDISEEEAQGDEAERAPVRAPGMTPGQRARALGQKRPALPTGFETIDKACRGGWRLGGVVVIGGAPGAGKTTLAVQLARAWVTAGHVVTILAADESADGLLIRYGQGLGWMRERLEEGDRGRTEALGESLEEIATTLFLYDADQDDASIEAAAALTVQKAGGRPAVLIVDSIQRAQTDAADLKAEPRARIDASVMALKKAAKPGVLIVATSELSRGAYRSRNQADAIDDIAAFKESGGIEYGADVALVLRSVKGLNGVIDVSMAKNRWGQKLPSRMALNPTTASFTEVRIPDDESDRGPVDHLADDLEKVREVLRGVPGINGRDAIRLKMAGVGKGRASEAIRALEQMGELENKGNDRRPSLYLVEPSQPSGRAPGDLGEQREMGLVAEPSQPSRPSGSLRETSEPINPPSPPTPLGGEGYGEGVKPRGLEEGANR